MPAVALDGPSAKRPEIRALTGLRAVAALAVVVHHTKVPPSAPDWVVAFARDGFVGVPLFFMLSGFVLAYNYPTLRPTDGRALTRFWIARIARVMPLYWVVLVWIAITRQASGAGQHVESFVLQALALQAWSNDVNVAAGFYNPPGWSISVEIFLYVAFPFLVVGGAAVHSRWGRRGLLAGAALTFAAQVAVWAWFVVADRAGLPATDPASARRWLYRTPLTRLFEFAIGIGLAFLWTSGARLGRRATVAAQLGVVVVVITLSLGRDTTNHAVSAAFFGTIWTVPFAVLIFSLAGDEGPLGRLLATGPMVTLGAASYALYITHFRLLPGFGKDLVQTAPGIWPYVMVLVIIGLTLLVAEGAHRYIEVPGRRLVLALARDPRRSVDRHVQRDDAVGA